MTLPQWLFQWTAAGAFLGALVFSFVVSVCPEYLDLSNGLRALVGGASGLGILALLIYYPIKWEGVLDCD